MHRFQCVTAWLRVAVMLLVFAASVVPLPAQSQQPAGGSKSLASSLGVFVYRAKNQTPDQQASDENSCYGWAKQQTGIDPAAPPPAAQAPDAKKGGAVKGAMGGAGLGAAAGAIAGDAGTGAAVGATVGAVRGRRQQKKENKQAEQQAQQQAQAQQKATMDTFKKGFSACMEGRGYTVK